MVYQCALAGLGLSADTCVAVEDTSNGNKAALSAGLKTIITTHTFTENDDFTDASLVLNHLGEPNNPFEISQGITTSQTCVDLELINEILMYEDGLNYIENEMPNFASNLN